MNGVPFLDVRAAYVELRTEIDTAISRVLESGCYVLGEEVAAFESEFAAYCGVRHAVAVANGLDALRLALLALGVGPGDEVIVPANTYIATWLAVSQCGATPVPVEPSELTFNLDPGLLEAAITRHTKVILPVHLYGLPADLDPIIEIARKRGVRVVEDAAQAHGASYKGRRLGAHGDAVCWSFYPGKNLGAFGDGGAVTTDNPAIADRLRVLRNYGSRQKYVNEERGYNSRLDPLQAAALRVKLKSLDSWNGRRTEIAGQYVRGLVGAELKLPEVPSNAQHVWHLFVVRHTKRDRLQAELAQRGIATLIHYPIPPHRQEAYKPAGFPASAFPISNRMADEVLSLPIGPHLTTAQVQDVIAACRAAA